MISEVIFHHPFTCMIAGPSKSGKTTLLHGILKSNSKLIDKPPQRIVYCYSRWQPAYDRLKTTINDIEFKEGLPDIDNFKTETINMIILDDLMHECGKDQSFMDNARDRSQINHLARQMFPSNPNFLVECFQDAIKSFRYGYIFLDFTQNIDEAHRVQTRILPSDTRIIYEMKK